MKLILGRTVARMSAAVESEKNDEDARSRVEDCVASICRRMDLNALELNHGKTEIMLIHSMYRPYESFTI